MSGNSRPVTGVPHECSQTPSRRHSPRENQVQHSHLAEAPASRPVVAIGWTRGHIVVDSIEPIAVTDITYDLARESGFEVWTTC